MSLASTMSITSSLHSLKISTPKSQFLNGTTSLSHLSKPTTFPQNPAVSSLPIIRAVRKMQGRVVCSTNNKTVAVEVVRLDTHPKYRRRVRTKKKYQAHDPDNKFQVGDWVQLERCKPISKNKSFMAVPAPSRNREKKEDGNGIGIPLQSEQQLA